MPRLLSTILFSFLALQVGGCPKSICGDGIKDIPAGEECDDKNQVDNDACTNTCTLPACGDSIVQAGEGCDDGNTINNDACTNECKLAACGDGIIQTGAEECDNGAANSDTSPNACRTDCSNPSCGDGVVDTNEECEPPNSATCDDSCLSLDINDPPSFDAITDRTVSEDAGATNVSITNILAGPANENTQLVTMSTSSSNTAIVPNPTVTGVAGGSATLTFTPATDKNGTVTITVTATDSGGTANGGINTAQRTFTLAVVAVNDAPSFDTINDQAVNESVTPNPTNVTITGVTPGPVTATDEAGQVVAFTATSNNTSLVPNPNITGSGATRTLTFQPNAGVNGTATITVIANDNSGGTSTAQRTFTITVTNVPRCGDATFDAGEQCDDGNNIDADGCEADCTTPICANGVIDPGELCLDPQQPTPTGSAPEPIATADFNNDGRLDLVVGNRTSANVSVFLSNGNGTFQTQTFGAINNPESLTVGDLNQDNRPDILVANGSGSSNIGVLLCNANGSFQTVQLSTIGVNPFEPEIVDLNNDGQNDLVVVNLSTNNLGVSLGNGNGTFQAQTTFAVGVEPRQVIAQDINNDTKPDLIAVNVSTNEVRVVLNTSVGGVLSFQAPQAFAAGSASGLVLAGDVGGDAKLDLIILNQGVSGNSLVTVLTNISTNATNLVFNTQASFLTGGLDSAGMTIQDLNGDSKLDLAIPNFSTDNISIFLGNGNSTFQNQPTLSSIDGPNGIASGDFNNDGVHDLAVVNFFSSNLKLFLSNP